MTPEAPSEAGIRRALLELALSNSARSVLLQLVAVGVIVALALSADRGGPATAVGLLGVMVAGWRLNISRVFAQPGDLSDERLRRLQFELEGNAALAGLMWAVATLIIYPALPGTNGTAYVGMVFGSITVAAFFMPLLGRSFVILVMMQIGALVLASLFIQPVRSVPLATLAVIFGVTLTRAA